MYSSLEGRYVLLTGATGQVGRELARAFALCGANLLLTSRQKADAEKLAGELAGLSPDGSIKGFALDLSAPENVDSFAGELKRAAWPVEIIVHAARSQEALAQEQGRPPWKNWQAGYAVDVVGPYFLTMALVHSLAQRGRGSVVFVSSVYGLVAVNQRVYEDKTWAAPIHYAASKAAQIHLARELAVRLAPGVRVNAIAYGGVEGRMDPEFVRRYHRLCPQGRLLKPEDLPGPALFLASDESSAVTGHVLGADGGWTTW